MKLVLNKCYGGFHIPYEVCQSLGCTKYDEIDRDHFALVEFVEERGEYKEGFSCLRVVTIPETATDWEVNEYDGFETVTYVVDGKIHHA